MAVRTQSWSWSRAHPSTHAVVVVPTRCPGPAHQQRDPGPRAVQPIATGGQPTPPPRVARPSAVADFRAPICFQSRPSHLWPRWEGDEVTPSGPVRAVDSGCTAAAAAAAASLRWDSQCPGSMPGLAAPTSFLPVPEVHVVRPKPLKPPPRHPPISADQMATPPTGAHPPRPPPPSSVHAQMQAAPPPKRPESPRIVLNSRLPPPPQPAIEI